MNGLLDRLIGSARQHGAHDDQISATRMGDKHVAEAACANLEAAGISCWLDVARARKVVETGRTPLRYPASIFEPGDEEGRGEVVLRRIATQPSRRC